MADDEDVLHVWLPRYSLAGDEALSGAAARLEQAERAAADAMRGGSPDPAILNNAAAALKEWGSYANSVLGAYTRAVYREPGE